MKLILKITAGILLAAFLIGAGRLVVVAYAAHVATEKFEQIAAQQKTAAEERLRKAQAEKAAEAMRQEQIAQRERLALARIAANERAEKARERAFLEQYEPPDYCVNPQSDNVWVQCVDLQRAAKKAFLARYFDPNQPHRDIRIGEG